MAIKKRNPRLQELFKTPERKTYTVAGATLLLTILMVFVVIRPSVSRMLTQIAENNERREVLGDMDQKLTNLENLIGIEEQRSLEIETLNNEILPDSRREDEFIANLAVGAEDAGLSLLSIGFADDISKLDVDFPSGVDAYILSVAVQGSREEIESFVNFLERFPRTVNITEFSISRLADDEVQKVGIENAIRADIQSVVYLWGQ